MRIIYAQACLIGLLLAGAGCVCQQQRRDCIALLMQSTVKEIKVAAYPSFLAAASEKQRAMYETLDACTDEAQLRQSWPEIRAAEVELRDRTLEYAKLFDEKGVLVHVYMLNKIVEDLDEVIALIEEEDNSSDVQNMMNRILRDYQMLLQTLSAEIDYCSP